MDIKENMTFFRLPDLLTIASEEEEHLMDGPAEFELTIVGVIVDADDIVVCECGYPNAGEDKACAACEKSLEGSDRITFWKLVPDMQDVRLKVEPLSLGPPLSDNESPELNES